MVFLLNFLLLTQNNSPLEDHQDTNLLNPDSSLAIGNNHGGHHLQTDLNLLASLPQAPIPPHEFAHLSELYVDHPSSSASTHQSSHMDDQDLIKDHVYSPEYISL